MAFDATLEMTGKVAKIALSGELDATVAPDFKAKVEEAVAQAPKRLVLMLEDLEYMSSAGLRVFIFAKQKIGADVDVYVVAAQEPVLETLTMTGFHHSVVIMDVYDADVIENI
jgi:anti-anti-sigma factor